MHQMASEGAVSGPWAHHLMLRLDGGAWWNSQFVFQCVCVAIGVKQTYTLSSEVILKLNEQLLVILTLQYERK